MLRNGHPYRHNLYPPLRPASCPLCGAALQGDEPLCGQIAFPALGLPWMEFPLCVACKPSRLENAAQDKATVARALAQAYYLDGPLSDTFVEEPPLEELRGLALNPEPLDPDRFYLDGGPLPITSAFFAAPPQVDRLKESLTLPAARPAKPEQAHFTWLPHLGLPQICWGSPAPSAARLLRRPAREEGAEQPARRFADALPLAGELGNTVHGMPSALWDVTLDRTSAAETYTLSAQTGSAAWFVEALPLAEVRRPGYAVGWLRTSCAQQAEVAQTGVPAVAAAGPYFILRVLETARPAHLNRLNDSLDELHVGMGLVSLVCDALPDLRQADPRGNALSDDILEKWARQYLSATPPAALPGTYNQLRSIDLVARLINQSIPRETLAAQRRGISYHVWVERCRDQQLAALSLLGRGIETGGRFFDDPGELVVQGIAFPVEGDDYLDDWMQWFELLAWSTPSAAGLEFLFPGLKFPGFTHYEAQAVDVLSKASDGDRATLWSAVESPEAMTALLRTVGQTADGRPTALADDELCYNVAHALREDALANQTYVPLGGYRLTLPADLVLRSTFGIEAVRLWFEPDLEGQPDNPPIGCWVRDEAQAYHRKGGGRAWWWDWSSQRNQSPLPHYLWPLMLATLSAIHRDLLVAGETVIREVPAGSAAGLSPRPAAETGRRRHHSKRDLPGRRYEVRGYPARNIAWCDEIELQRVRRVAHGVRGHIMRLTPPRHPSAEALARARAFGLVPPDGCTFVRPHLRGLAPDTSDDEALRALSSEIRAVGLHTLMVFTTQAPPAAGPDDN